MNEVFADTFYFLALLDSREDRHLQATEFSRASQLHILTTEWVLAEFGDAYCHPIDRADFGALVRASGETVGEFRARTAHYLGAGLAGAVGGG